MATGSGIGALQSAIGRVKKKILPYGEKKISVVFYDPFTGEIDWPPEEKLNSGILLVPGEVSEAEWEMGNFKDDQKLT